MKLPEELKEKLKEKLEELFTKYKNRELKNAYSNISDKYRHGARNGKSLLNKEEEVCAYILARMPATYSAVYKAFSAVYPYVEGEDFVSLMDVGAGTGSATWALHQFINFQKIICMEKEENMMHFGKMLMEDTDLQEVTTWEKADVRTMEIKNSADVLVASYMLNEIEDERKLEILEKIWSKTNQILFLIEPGTPENYQNIMKYREYIIKNGGYMIAPCPHQNKCELSENDWCHFTCRVERTRVHKNIKDADSPFEDEKFIYLVASKKKIKGAKNRILRHPKIEKGYVEVKVCTEEGIKEQKITKSQKEIYKIVRKADAGDEINACNV